MTLKCIHCSGSGGLIRSISEKLLAAQTANTNIVVCLINFLKVDNNIQLGMKTGSIIIYSKFGYYLLPKSQKSVIKKSIFQDLDSVASSQKSRISRNKCGTVIIYIIIRQLILWSETLFLKYLPFHWVPIEVWRMVPNPLRFSFQTGFSSDFSSGFLHHYIQSTVSNFLQHANLRPHCICSVELHSVGRKRNKRDC